MLYWRRTWNAYQRNVSLHISPAVCAKPNLMTAICTSREEQVRAAEYGCVHVHALSRAEQS